MEDRRGAAHACSRGEYTLRLGLKDSRRTTAWEHSLNGQIAK